MRYLIRKFESMAEIPLFIAYYLLGRTSFSLRCKECGKWLFDQQFLRPGVCESCSRELAAHDPGKFYGLQKFNTFSTNLSQDHHDRRILSKLGSGDILDVGCSDGRLLGRIRGPNHLYGLDMSAQAIGIAKVKLKDANFCVGDARRIPFDSNTFDYVSCTEVLEHIEGDEVIEECYRVLKVNGIALIAVPNGIGPSGKYYPYHIRLFSYRSIQDALKRAGFEIVSGNKFGLYVPFFSRFLVYMSLVTGRHFPFSAILNIDVPEKLADQFLIECQKVSR
jgi:SAM-dependent methyltransferase